MAMLRTTIHKLTTHWYLLRSPSVARSSSLLLSHPLCAQQLQQQQRSRTDNDDIARRGFAALPKHKSAPGSAGRIAMTQTGGKKAKGGGPRMCVGCGTAVLSGQTAGDSMFTTGAEAAAGISKKQAKKARFVNLEDSQVKNGFLCNRCKALQSNNIWAAYDAIADVDAAVFTQQLKHIVARRRFGMCIVVADATDAEHSAAKNLRRSIGKLPAVLVLAKCDLLPRMSERDKNALSRKVANVTGNRFIASFAVSAHTGSGILALAEYLLLNLRGRDVFCVGAANVGKSTLVQRLAATIAPSIHFKGKGRQVHKRKEMAQNMPITASHLPGTTLQAVRVPCFPSNRHALWDTPGIIQSKAVQYSLFPPHFMEPLARAEPIPLSQEKRLRPGSSILIEAAWMDPIPDNHDDEDDGEEHDEDPDEDDDWHNGNGKPRQSRKNEQQPQNELPPIEKTCVLARIDFTLDEDQESRHKQLFVRPYLHPSLRMRIVPTRLAPDSATLPQEYVERIQERLKHSTRNRGKQRQGAAAKELVTSRPLARFTTPKNPEGLLIPTDKEMNEFTGMTYMDVSFASLGWIQFWRDTSFRLVPWCVEGSVFSKRPALYPTNLAQEAVNVQRTEWEEEAQYLESEEASDRLAKAAREGRKSISKQGGNEDDDYRGDYVYEEDDEWYS